MKLQKSNHSDPDDATTLKAWYFKRRMFAVIYTVQHCLLYFEYTAVSISALYYYKETFKVSNPSFFYGFSMASLYFTTILFVNLCGRYTDRTRNVRRVAFVTIAFSAAGNLIYTMTYSKWLPIIGRLLCGSGDGFRTAMAGELSRVYHPTELSKCFSRMELLGVVAISIAPCTPIIFSGVHFHVTESWLINQQNAVALLLAILNMIMLVWCYTSLSNITLEPAFTLAKEEIDMGKDTNMQETQQQQQQQHHKLWTLKDVFKRYDVLFMLISQGFLMGQFSQIEMLINITAIQDFGFNLQQLGLATLIGVIVSTIIMFIIQKTLLNSQSNLFFLYIIIYVKCIMIESLLNAVVASEIKSSSLLMACSAVLVALNMLVGYGSLFCARCLLFALTPSHSASIIESYRIILSCIGLVFAFFTGSFVYTAKFQVLPVYNVIVFGVIFVFLWKRRFYLEKQTS